MNGNNFVSFMLRTPLHALLGDTMLITVTGCRTGKQYSTPVGFYREDDALWVLTHRDRTWWRNVRQGARISLLLRGKTVEAFAEAELEEKAVESHMREYVRRMPMTAKPLGIRMQDNVPNPEDVQRVAKDRLFVKIRPDR